LVLAAAQHPRIDLSQVSVILHRHFVAFASAGPVPDVLETNAEVLKGGRCSAVIPEVEGVRRLKALGDFARFAWDIVFFIVVMIEEDQFLTVYQLVQYATLLMAYTSGKTTGQTKPTSGAAQTIVAINTALALPATPLTARKPVTIGRAGTRCCGQLLWLWRRRKLLGLEVDAIHRPLEGFCAAARGSSEGRRSESERVNVALTAQDFSLR
jgi:hypothetical protein